MLMESWSSFIPIISRLDGTHIFDRCKVPLLEAFLRKVISLPGSPVPILYHRPEVFPARMCIQITFFGFNGDRGSCVMVIPHAFD